MKAKLGAIVTEGRNKLGDVVFSKNHYGSFLRLRIETPYRDSTRTKAVRDRLISISRAWAGLTQDQRDLWIAAVPLWSRKDIFGDRRLLSGNILFAKLNNFLDQLGFAQIDVPPLPGFVDPFNSIKLSASTDPLEIILTYEPAIDDMFYRSQLFVSKPISQGIKYPYGHFYYLLAFSSANPSPFDFAAQYPGRWVPPVEVTPGDKIFARVRKINIITGQSGLPMWTFAIAT